jgi:ribosomal-protein-alanine N-acetyltransferase
MAWVYDRAHMTIELDRVIPILRIFDIAKAKAFYLDYLGFTLDWEHRFEPKLPLYMQVSRGNVRLHLSEHHGDGTPGTAVYIQMRGLAELHADLRAKEYDYLRPGLDPDGPGGPTMNLLDPFGNTLRFTEPKAK